MTDRIRFYELYDNRSFRLTLSQIFMSEIEAQILRFKTAVRENRRDEMKKFSAAGFTEESDFKHIWDSRDFSRATYFKFHAKPDPPKLSIKTLDSILSSLEPLVKAEDIIDRALSDFGITWHPDVLASFADTSALLFAEAQESDEHFDIAGPAIQIRALGPQGEVGAEPDKIGLDPKDLRILSANVPFDNFDRRLVSIEKLRELNERGEDNGVKLSLTSISPIHALSDAGHRTTLQVAKTDYETVVSCLASLANTESDGGEILLDRSGIRRQHGSTNPAENRVPNSLCLHYILRFKDMTYLAIHRHAGVAYDRRRVSISGEEQLKPSDLKTDSGYSPAQNWVYRALLEEVFPRLDVAIGGNHAKNIIAEVAYFRYLSMIYEERYCNFSVCCFIQMKSTLESYKKIYQDCLKMSGKIDYEGNRFWFHEDEIRNFFLTGALRLTPFKDSVKPIVAVAGTVRSDAHNTFKLHSSSLHRLHRVAEMFNLLSSA